MKRMKRGQALNVKINASSRVVCSCSDAAKFLAVELPCRLTGATQREIGEHYGGITLAGVSLMLDSQVSVPGIFVTFALNSRTASARSSAVRSAASIRRFQLFRRSSRLWMPSKPNAPSWRMYTRFSNSLTVSSAMVGSVNDSPRT